MEVDIKFLGYIAIKSCFNRYLCCENLILGQFLVFDRASLGEWETFELYNAENGFCLLRAHNGKWLTVMDGQITCEKYMSSRSIFALKVWQKHDDYAYKISLQTYLGTWLCANHTTLILKEHCLEWEKFTLEVLSGMPRSVEITNLPISSTKPVSCSQTYTSQLTMGTQTENSTVTVVIPLNENNSTVSEDEWTQVQDVNSSCNGN
eukprot:NODE_27_length_39007_cov_1.590650.p21 type:complete len:206 gc:universal NODE_27_length_39007_cov_1.590650:27354-27971(+)